MKIFFAFTLLFCAFTVSAQKLRPLPGVKEEWSKPQEPFRIAGNLYYVGTYDLACYLVTTPKGHILINTGLAESAPEIEKHMATLGFKLKDIKILLTMQAHYDHVAAMAAIKKATGAAMMTMAGDVQVMKDGGNSDYLMGGKGSTFEPVPTDRVLHDGDKIELAGTRLTVYSTPGHTKGSASYTMDVKDGNKTYRVLLANMPTMWDEVRLPSMPGYPNAGKDFGAAFSTLRKIRFDIFLAAHASQFDMHEKYKTGESYNPDRFVDHELFLKNLGELEKVYEERMARKK